MLSLADAIYRRKTRKQIAAHLQYGVDLNQIDEYGFTPLIEAAIADNASLVELLIRHGANVNLQDAVGGYGTPLGG